MVTRVRVPTIDANIEEVTITNWFVREGDAVRKGARLAKFTTDKASFEFEAPASGVVRRIVAPTKSVVPVGYVIALVGAAAEPLPEVDRENAKRLAARRAAAPAARATAPAATEDARPRVRATPAARRLARELGLDLARWQQETGQEIATEEALRAYGERLTRAAGR